MGGIPDRAEGVTTEYYSREAVIDFIRSYRHSTDVAFHMEKHINEIPAADVRPVVLCRECKSYNRPRLGFCETHLVRMHGDDFCSYGKKREES